MNNDCIIANEEDCNSLFNDTDKVIQGLTNRLKDFISCDEINKVNFPYFILFLYFFITKCICIKTLDHSVLW